MEKYDAKNKLGMGVYNLDPRWMSFEDFDWYVDQGYINTFILNMDGFGTTVCAAQKLQESGGQAWLGCPVFTSKKESLSDYMGRLVNYTKRLNERGVWDRFIGFNFDEPLLQRDTTNDDLLAVTKAMHEEFGMRIYPVFSTYEILGQKGNWNDPNGTLILESYATEYLTDIGFDSYGYDFRPPTEAMAKKLASVSETYPQVTDTASYYRFMFDSLKDIVVNKEAKVWVTPSMYYSYTWAGCYSDEDYNTAHLKGLFDILMEQEHPGGIMGYTFKSWSKAERGLDFFLNPRNPERWTKFEAAMREIHDKIKDIEIK